MYEWRPASLPTAGDTDVQTTVRRPCVCDHSQIARYPRGRPEGTRAGAGKLYSTADALAHMLAGTAQESRRRRMRPCRPGPHDRRQPGCSAPARPRVELRALPRGHAGPRDRRAARLQRDGNMTLLIAIRTADGFAAISDRGETYANMPPKDVKKYHMDKKCEYYISFAGDGKLAKEILGRISRSRTGRADVVRRIHDIALDLSANPRRRSGHVVGILIIAERKGFKLYNIEVKGRDVDINESNDAVSVHGDCGTVGMCQYVIAKVGFSSMTCEAAARKIHVLASDVGKQVESVGKPSCGFDLIWCVADSQPKKLERYTEEFGHIDVSLHMTEPLPPVI